MVVYRVSYTPSEELSCQSLRTSGLLKSERTPTNNLTESLCKNMHDYLVSINSMTNFFTNHFWNSLGCYRSYTPSYLSLEFLYQLS